MSTPPDYFDANAEPSNFQGRFSPDPAESKVPFSDGREDELSTIRDSVFNEPSCIGGGELKQDQLRSWIAAKRRQCTPAGSLGITLLAALAAGPFAVLGAFMMGRPTLYAVLYAVLFAPVIEELLKQSGMIYLLEKHPYRLFTGWQFVAAAVISAGVFAVLENLIYIYVYVDADMLSDPGAFARFRWTVCPLVHILCSVIASCGLIRVWKRQLQDGRAADLAHGFAPFAVAMTIHGLYNLTVWLLDLKF
jgi:hypothetical protein